MSAQAYFSKFFQLRENPFAETPSTRFFYGSSAHQQALQQLEWVIEQGKGFGVLTGSVGTGKSLIARMLLKNKRLENTAYIINPLQSPVELLISICDEFNLSLREVPQTVQVYLRILHQFLVENAKAGRRSILVIDEAQKLSFDCLETIRLLNNLETEDSKLLQVILIGQEELKAKLLTDELRQLNQRVSVHPELRALSPTETEAYLKHRILQAGHSSLIRFDPKAVKVIWTLSKGIPRVINRMAELVMMAAELRQVRLVDADLTKITLAPEEPLAFRNIFRRGSGL